MAFLHLLLSVLLTYAAGSKIAFDANPPSIQDSLTSELMMRCALNDTASLFTGGVIGKRDVTETASNVQHVTSIIIMRNNGEHVASVTNYDSAKPLVDLNNLNVTGDVSGSVGERGFIELTWEYPTAAQSGEYVCEINAVDDAGHNVVFTSSLEVGVTQPSIDELIKLVKVLQTEKTDHEKQIDQISNDITSLESLASNCNSPTHLESGSVKCDDSRGWSNDNQGDWSNYVTHKFQTPYPTTPLVKLGVDYLDHENNDNTRFDITVQKVDRFGFTVKCRTWAGSHIYDIGVSWISLPASS